ncbi:class I SAM-dependent DNA methyltransferase [Sinisalibacter aestuarii]|uniref:Methyltransferase n=1 Tax=Sinisalibacter aestuarii TaxID=2949426 RepID=A0ABQ5LN47_9RHOB|nr:class I SAM-dependent methyltransferase [Sinisalibacter aestuarii]GKY86203.1 methyltransferase [Sinisalibacter aestuarii]
MSDAGTIRFYDEAAKRFDTLRADGPVAPALARFMAQLAPGASVLDLGCGPGISAAHLIREGFDVTALDASASLLDVARRLAPEAHFVHAGFDALDAVAAYDAVWANFALLHAPRAEMPGHLAAIARALRPEGLFHLSMLTGTGEQRDDLDRAYTYYTPEDLRRLTEAAGFVELDAETGTQTGMGGKTEPFIALLLRRLP